MTRKLLLVLLCAFVTLGLGCGGPGSYEEGETGSESGAVKSEPAESKPRPKPAPKPQPAKMTLAAGTPIEIEMMTALSSKESQVGDPFKARVMKDVAMNGKTVIPAGSIVSGSVSEAKSTKKIGGRARLGLLFEKVEVGGAAVAISASLMSQGKSETKKDAATIGGATAGGAILGRIIERDDEAKGTLIGAIVGGAVGTAIAAKTEGQEIQIPTGMMMAIQLDQATEFTVY